MSESNLKSTNLRGKKLAGGRFHIFDLIGSGGMADVYRAKDTKTGADVAVKAPKAHLMSSPEFVKRFLWEINTMKELKHPHILPVVFAGRQEDLLFAVFPFMVGGSLKQRIQGGQTPLQHPPLTREKLQWLFEIATALDYVHGQKLLHRDVKPDNILFDAQGRAYLSDFGVVRALESDDDTDMQSLTQTGAVLGTAPYMAPDLILGKKPYTGKVDQYALGITVYEVLAGNRPFKGQAQTVLILHTKTPPVPLHQKRPDLPRPLVSSVHQALAKTPEQRFPTCTAFAQSVISSIGQAPFSTPVGPPVTPFPPDETVSNGLTISNATRPSRKKLIWIGAAALAALLLIITIAIFSKQGDSQKPVPSPRTIVGKWFKVNGGGINGHSEMSFTKHGSWQGNRNGQIVSGPYEIVNDELHIRESLGLYKYHMTMEDGRLTLTCFAAPMVIPFVPNVELNRTFEYERAEE